MSVAEIITEIDAYLLCLRRARQLLAGSDGLARRRNAACKQAATEAKETASAAATAPRIQMAKALREAVRRKATITEIERVALAVAPDGEKAVQTMLFQPHTTAQRLPVGKGVLSSAEWDHAQNTVRRRSEPRKQTTVPKSAKPANALSGPVPFRVVVLSAEEAQKAREQAARSVISDQRASSAGLTGRTAFEALFKDGVDASIASSV
jgi:hypothetical protein